MAIEIPVVEFEALADKVRRADMYRAVTLQLERKVEDLDYKVRDLTDEVNNLEVEPEYTCDCSCDGDLDDIHEVQNRHMDSLELILKRLEAIEARLGM